MRPTTASIGGIQRQQQTSSTNMVQWKVRVLTSRRIRSVRQPKAATKLICYCQNETNKYQPRALSPPSLILDGAETPPKISN